MNGLALALVLALPATPVVKCIATSGHGTTRQVEITGQGALAYSVFTLDEPPRLVIDVPAVNDCTKCTRELNDPMVRRISARSDLEGSSPAHEAAEDSGAPPQIFAGPQAASAVTFDDAIALAVETHSGSIPPPRPSTIPALRRALLPAVRAEVSANASRTLDFFRDGPVDYRSTSSVIAFDYSLFTRTLTRARIAAAGVKLRRLADRKRLDDPRFTQLLDAFGQLYLTQKQMEILEPLARRLSSEAGRSAVLVSSGELTNLAAADWREIALSFASQLLELEARRIDAAARLGLLTGLEPEPAVVIDFEAPASDAGGGEPMRDDHWIATSIAVEDSRLRLMEVTATNRFRATLSGFAGLGAAESSFRDVQSDGTFGVYGLRVHLSYPLIGGISALQIAEARAGLQQSLAWQDAARHAARVRAAEYRLRAETAARRIDLLRQSVDSARQREESLQRLVSGGLRSRSDLLRVEAERTRREVDLLASLVERWKASQLLGRVTAPAEDGHR